MINPDDPDHRYGEISGSVWLSAENADGETLMLSEEFTTEICEPALETDFAEEEEPEEDTSGQWILAVTVTSCILAVLAAVLITKKRVEKRLSRDAGSFSEDSGQER